MQRDCKGLLGPCSGRRTVLAGNAEKQRHNEGQPSEPIVIRRVHRGCGSVSRLPNPAFLALGEGRLDVCLALPMPGAGKGGGAGR